MISHSIILVNYKSSGLVIDCLESIYRWPVAAETEIIVVDNASGDDSENRIRQKYPGVVWISMPGNMGFARGNNAGIRAAKGNILLLLNSDTVNQDDAIAKCFRRFSQSDFIACGVQLMNPDGTPQISGNYFIKGGLNQLMALPYTGRLLRWLGILFKVKKTHAPEAIGNVEVDWINGAFLMVKKETIEQAGLLDEDFFLYFEEIEWCSRLLKAGKMCIYGDLRVVHLQGATTNEVFQSKGQGYYNLYDRKGLQIMVSSLLRIRKQYGIGWYLFHLMAYLITIPVFFVAGLIRLPFERKKQQAIKMFSGYVGNCWRLLALSGKMIRNRPWFYKMV